MQEKAFCRMKTSSLHNPKCTSGSNWISVISSTKMSQPPLLCLFNPYIRTFLSVQTKQLFCLKCAILLTMRPLDCYTSYTPPYSIAEIIQIEKLYSISRVCLNQIVAINKEFYLRSKLTTNLLNFLLARSGSPLC